MKLNLGCGHDVRDGWINADIAPGPGVDVICNANERLPFDDEQFTHVLLDNVLEHLQDPYRALLEVHRVTEAGGSVVVRVPHYRAKKARIITHRHLFDEHSLDPVIRGRHLESTSPENRAYFELDNLEVDHLYPLAWHQRRYFGHELIAWHPHEIEWRLTRLARDP